jgi:hypothetical protein
MIDTRHAVWRMLIFSCRRSIQFGALGLLKQAVPSRRGLNIFCLIAAFLPGKFRPRYIW